MLSYQECINWLFKQFPNYQKEGKNAYKADLENISDVLSQLNNPHKKLKFVHVAGTNGKGSVCSMISSALTEAGYKTGLFTSPHLLDFRERIRINGSKIPKENVIDFCNKTQVLECKPSFFEITFAMALEHFKNEKCDICIIEVGLGGRLDATNIITPTLTAITSIGLDHTNILGNTLSEIAKEKAGIIKKDVPLVLGEKKTTKEIISIAKEKNSSVYLSKEQHKTFDSPFDYGYPLENAKTASTCLQILNKNSTFKNTEVHFNNGLNNIRKNTGYKARLEILNKNPNVIFDGGHNEQGIKKSIDYIQNKYPGKIHFIYGSSKEKNHELIFKAIPKEMNLYLCPFKSERSLGEKELKYIKNKYRENAIICSDVNEALNQGLMKAETNDSILIFGSFFLYEEILQ